jgi:hypothetical protein
MREVLSHADLETGEITGVLVQMMTMYGFEARGFIGPEWRRGLGHQNPARGFPVQRRVRLTKAGIEAAREVQRG